jgi:putative membrane protein
MGAAVSLSVLFLASYLTYHFGREGIVTRFPGEGAAKAAYFAILFTHTPLAATLLPLLSVALFHAFKGNIEKHRRIVRFVFPIWLYVSVTGVVIYVMLYRIAW